MVAAVVKAAAAGHGAIVRNLESGAEKGSRGEEEGRRGGGQIELCFRDSLFLARKKAQTRVAFMAAAANGRI